MFYTMHHENSSPLAPSYRHLAVINATDAPKHFYHLNAEHAICDANVEVANSRNVHVYGFKSEGKVCGDFCFMRNPLVEAWKWRQLGGVACSVRQGIVIDTSMSFLLVRHILGPQLCRHLDVWLRRQCL